jgi:hypothetical protein
MQLIDYSDSEDDFVELNESCTIYGFRIRTLRGYETRQEPSFCVMPKAFPPRFGRFDFDETDKDSTVHFLDGFACVIGTGRKSCTFVFRSDKDKFDSIRMTGT